MYNGERAIKISKEEYEENLSYIKKHLEIIEFEGDVDKRAKEILDEVLYGWPRASKELSSRIKQKLGGNNRQIRKTNKRGENEPRANIKDYLPDGMTIEERRFILKREKEYLRDYDFNTSSDFPLFMEVLFDELLLHKMKMQVIQDPESISSREMEDVQRRLRTNMEKLGVLRSQRLDSQHFTDGNIAQLSAIVEQKLENIKKLEDKEYKKKVQEKLLKKFSGVDLEELEMIIEEIKFQQKHNLFPEQNHVPDAEANKILKELGVNMDE